MVSGDQVQVETTTRQLAPRVAVVCVINRGIARPEVSNLTRISFLWRTVEPLSLQISEHGANQRIVAIRFALYRRSHLLIRSGCFDYRIPGTRADPSHQRSDSCHQVRFRSFLSQVAAVTRQSLCK